MVPKTPFVTRHVENEDSDIPFEIYWNGIDKKVWNARVKGENGQKMAIYPAPKVNVEYLSPAPKSEEEKRELNEIAAYFHAQVVKRLQKKAKEQSSFIVATKKGKGVYTLELAVLALTPTNTEAGWFLTAMSAVKAGGLVRHLMDKGNIVVAGRLKDERGHVISEFADAEEDKASLLGIDLKDFQKYGYHKKSIDELAREIVEVYSLPVGTYVMKILPILNPT